jgi:hypothetical protein
MTESNTKNTQKSQSQPHTPGQTEGNRKGLDDQNASKSKPRHQSAAQPMPEPRTEDPIPTFDEGERRPSPIESSDQGGLRTPAPVVSANPKDYDRDKKASQADATMPPGEGQDPKRNTM